MDLREYLEILVEQEKVACSEYPVNDVYCEKDAQWQYNKLPHYYGRQLTLRVELAKMLVNLIDELLKEYENV